MDYGRSAPIYEDPWKWASIGCKCNATINCGKHGDGEVETIENWSRIKPILEAAEKAMAEVQCLSVEITFMGSNVQRVAAFIREHESHGGFKHHPSSDDVPSKPLVLG